MCFWIVVELKKLVNSQNLVYSMQDIFEIKIISRVTYRDSNIVHSIFVNEDALKGAKWLKVIFQLILEDNRVTRYILDIKFETLF